MTNAIADPRSYGHFCLLAKALERVGDRWAMLVVRDLLTGPKRFTDLMDRMAGITPKTLTRRLRDLEEDGLVAVDREPGRREVWYRLTPAGQRLQPALDQLLLWGLDTLASPPAADEPVHPDHVLYALRLALERAHVDLGSVRWTFHVPGAGHSTLRGERGTWALAFGGAVDAPPDVAVTASRTALARFLTTHREDGVELVGKPAALRSLRKALAHFPNAGARSGS